MQRYEEKLDIPYLFPIFVTQMRICIFCSANQQIDPDFFTATEALGRWAAAKGHTIVYGGVNQGLMECVAKAVKACGGKTVGVVPKIVETSGRISAYVDEVIPCANLHERKLLMEQQSDVYIALPGGIGTLDEIFSIASSYTIGYHKKKVILYNLKGFWDHLIHTLNGLQQRGFVRGQWKDYIQEARSLEELEALL